MQPFQYYFRGRRQIERVFLDLIGDRENQRVVYGSSSAGGRGGMVLIDHIRENILPASTFLRGHQDSGAYQVNCLTFDHIRNAE